MCVWGGGTASFFFPYVFDDAGEEVPLNNIKQLPADTTTMVPQYEYTPGKNLVRLLHDRHTSVGIQQEASSPKSTTGIWSWCFAHSENWRGTLRRDEHERLEVASRSAGWVVPWWGLLGNFWKKGLPQLSLQGPLGVEVGEGLINTCVGVNPTFRGAATSFPHWGDKRWLGYHPGTWVESENHDSQRVFPPSPSPRAWLVFGSLIDLSFDKGSQTSTNNSRHTGIAS